MNRRITQEEIRNLFGETMPMAAVEAIYNADEAGLSAAELREQLKDLAAGAHMEEVTYYPIQVVIEVGVTDGTTTGTLFCSYESMKLPTQAVLDRILKDVADSAPDGMRLMTRHEYLTIAAFNMTGERRPVPMSSLKPNEKWHDPDAANMLCTWWMDMSEFDA